MTVRQDETAYFAEDRSEATWLFAAGLLGVALVFVLGTLLPLG